MGKSSLTGRISRLKNRGLLRMAQRLFWPKRFSLHGAPQAKTTLPSIVGMLLLIVVVLCEMVFVLYLGYGNVYRRTVCLLFFSLRRFL